MADAHARSAHDGKNSYLSAGTAKAGGEDEDETVELNKRAKDLLFEQYMSRAQAQPRGGSDEKQGLVECLNNFELLKREKMDKLFQSLELYVARHNAAD